MTDAIPAEATPADALIPDAALRRAVGGQTPGANIDAADLALAKNAAYAYVLRSHSAREEWPGDYQLGAIRLAAGLYRDKGNPGITEPFSQGNVLRRATDVQIEQLLQIGRFALPQIG